MDNGLKKCLIELEEMDSNDLSKHGISMDALSESSLKELKRINCNLSEQIKQCAARIMREKSTIYPNLFDMCRSALQACLTFFARKLVFFITPQAIQFLHIVVAQFFYRAYLMEKASGQLKQLKEALSNIETESADAFHILEEFCALAGSQDVRQHHDFQGYKSYLKDKIKDSLERLSH
ncbi:hypothetical protein MBANPS3_002660 [Mucor bainieri]